jgi:glycosyltransferase involved in cell wall biosynthesis
VLKSIACQQRMPDEVIVADDGSGEETAQLVASWVEKMSVPLSHVWQENQGFRAGRSRNRAIAAARGEYVLLVDGDMVLDAHFVADHERVAEPGWFVQAPRVPTTSAGARRMIETGDPTIRPFAPGLRRRHLAFRDRWLARRFSRDYVTMPRIKSCNEGVWRSDLIRVNGFEEMMVGWGPEDKDCAARLMHAGVRGREVRFTAIAAHLHHESRASRVARENYAIFEETLATRRVRSRRGLDQHLAEFANGVPQSALPPWQRSQNRRVSESVAP